MITYIHKVTGDVKTTSLAMPSDWSPVERVWDENGKPRLRFKLDGATIELEEVKDGNPDPS